MQIFINILVASAYGLLMSVGFAMIFSCVRFLNFAHGATFTVGPYFVLVLTIWLKIPLIPAVLLAVGLSSVFGCTLEVLVYRPLRIRRANALILLLASLGAYLVTQNVIAMTLGDDSKTLYPRVVHEGMDILGARITPIQATAVVVALLAVGILIIALKSTKLGKAIRAIAISPELATVSGIAVDRIILVAFAIGSAFAGTAGILTALDVDMMPTMGLGPLMIAIVAVIIGGGSIRGAVFGTVLLAIVQTMSVWLINSEWKDATSFVVLLMFLIIKPYGFGDKESQKVVP